MKTYWYNNVARSSVTLLVAAVLTTLLWWLPQGGYSMLYLGGWLLCALGMSFIVEMSAQNAFLRVRSRMVSSLFLLMMAGCGFLHEMYAGSLLQLSLLFSFFALLRTCEKSRPELDSFHAYLVLSLGSLVWPPMLLLAIPQLFNQAVFLRSLTLRSFGACIVGLLSPYVFWSSASFLMGDISMFVAHVQETVLPVLQLVEEGRHQFSLASTYDWNTWSNIQAGSLTSFASRLISFHCAELAALILVLLMGATGSFFYIHTSYDDKIRVRMCHYTFIHMQAFLFLWLLVQPWLFPYLFPLLLFAVVPSCAYWFTFSNSWFARMWVWVLLLGWLCVAVLSLVPGDLLSTLTARI